MATKAPAVLIVDDNTEFADLLGTLIAEQGLVPILAHTAHNAQVLSKLYSPAALVIDLLLPDMTGHKLIKELVRPGGPPIFVMTGVFKGQTQMEKVKAITEIAAWYEKPFDTRVLIEQVVRLIGKQVVERVEHAKVGQVTKDFDIDILDPVDSEGFADAEHGGPKPGAKPRSNPLQAKLTPRPQAARSDELDLEIEISDDVDVSTLEASDDVDVDVDIDVEIGESSDDAALALWNVVENATPYHKIDPKASQDVDQTPPVPIEWPQAELPKENTPVPPSPFGGVTNPFQERVKSGFGREHSPTPAEVKTGLRAKMRSGDLKPATVARLLTAFYISHETGEIAFERGSERKVIYLSEGRPVYARSNQDSDRLGAIAKKAFGLSSQQIDQALAIARKTDRMIGEVLIEQGMIEVGKRPDLVREQTRAIIKSLLSWSEGRYVIGFNVRAEIQRAELEEHPASLVVGGIKEQFDLTRLRKLVPDKMLPMPSPNPPYELYELPMGDAEAMLFMRATGARNVRALLDEMAPRLDEHETRSFLYASLLLGMLVAGRGQRSQRNQPAAPEGA